MPTFPYLSQHDWLIYDEHHNPDAQITDTTMALQDSFVRYLPKLNQTLAETGLIMPNEPSTGQKAKAILHFYPSVRPTVLLGAKDKLLTNFSEGIEHLIQANYTVCLRPHGGLAVVNDEGVINLALVSDNAHFPLSIDEAYEQMVQLIALTLKPYGLQVEAYEVSDSYSPGKYDLVIDGLKIGGIAQRRFKTGLTTAAYLSINGNQTQRAQLIQNFYKIGLADERFPTVNPASMANIADFLAPEEQAKMTIEQFKQAILALLAEHSHYTLGDYTAPELQAIYQPRLEQARKRSLSIQPNKD